MKLRGHRVTLLLALVAVVLAAVVYADRFSISTDEAQLRQRHLFDAWRPDALTAIDLTIGERTAELRKTKGDDGLDSWSLVDNGNIVDADQQSVAQLLVSFEYATFERPASASPETMGLATPSFTASLVMGELRYRLIIGAEAPGAAGARYAEVDGGGRDKAHYVISKQLFQQLSLPPGALRSRHLLPYLSLQVERYQLEVGGEHYTLERGSWGGRTAGAFLLDDPKLGRIRAGRRPFDIWLGSLGRFEVSRFVPIPADPPKLRGRLRLQPLPGKKGAAQRPDGVLELFEAGAPCDNSTLVIRREPVAAAGCLATTIADALLVRPDYFVDLYAVGAAFGDIYELALKSPSDQIDVARKDTGWVMRAPQQGAADEDAVSRWLKAILETQGERVLAPESEALAELGLAPARATVRVVSLPARGSHTSSAERQERIDVGSAVEGAVYVRRHEDGIVLRLPVDVAEPLLPFAGALRSTQIYDLRRAQVRGLDIECGNIAQRLTRDQGSWTLLAPTNTGLKADAGLAQTLSDGLRTLKAVRWVPGLRSEDRFELASPWCVLKMRVANDASDPMHSETRAVTVRLGAKTTGGYYAVHDDELSVFVAPAGLARGTQRWLLDRGALLVKLSDVAQVELVKRGRDKPAVVKRQGDRWLAGDDGDALADQTHATLRALIAEGVMHLGAATANEGVDDPLLTMTITLTTPSSEPVRIVVGRAEIWNDARVFYVRRADVDATFGVAQSRLRPLIDAL